jgi:phage tail-like protein
VTRSASCTGFVPNRPALRTFDLWRLLVPAHWRDADVTQDVRRWLACLQEIVDLLLTTIDAFPGALADPDRASDAVIDAMLVDLGNPFPWPELDLTAAQRRGLLRNLVDLYRYAGTAVGIEAAVRLLLGVTVQVQPHLRTGWVLGRDALGSGRIAQITCTACAPYDFTAVPPPWTGTFQVETGPGQGVLCTPADFADPAAATASEVAAILATQLSGVTTNLIADGAPAWIDGGSGPFTLTAPARLLIAASGTVYDRTMQPDDFPDPTLVPLAYALPALQGLAPGVLEVLASPTGALRVRTRATGVAATLTVVNDPVNTGAVALGLPLGSTAAGSAGYRVRCVSTAVGAGSRIALTDPGCALDQVCAWWPYTAAGTGACVLAPTEARTRYTFDIETDSAVSAATEALIRRIADRLRCAHEHVGRIRPAPVAPPTPWILGVHQLNVDTRLEE